MADMKDLPLHAVLTRLHEVCSQATVARQKIDEASASLAKLQREELQLVLQAYQASRKVASAGARVPTAQKLEERLPGMFVQTMPLELNNSSQARQAAAPRPRSR